MMTPFLQNNLIILTDSYKVTHWRQYPKNTTNIYSYFESRGGEYSEVTFFGLQYILKKYFSEPIRKWHLDAARELLVQHFGSNSLFNDQGWKHIIKEHAGWLPLSIRAVPEGTTVGTRNVLMTVENTCPKCFWVTNYMETLLVQVWYPTTVCTRSRNAKKVILKYLQKTGDPALIDFKLHDFGFRGSGTVDSAAIGGCAHLVNFKGTDTLEALVAARLYYDEPCAGFSIPASEHSTMTSWGKEYEVSAFENMINQYGDNSLYACVSDSFNIYEACELLWGTILRDKVLNAKGTLVIRPDSGDPNIVVLKCLDILSEKFGYTVNQKRYKVLNPKVRIIQGDGVNERLIETLYATMVASGWSADNVGFGSGGWLLQDMTRDTSRYAFKCSAATVDGEDRGVFKDPITDAGKQSKQGRFVLYKKLDGYHTYNQEQLKDIQTNNDCLHSVYYNGNFENMETFEEIRKRAEI